MSVRPTCNTPPSVWSSWSFTRRGGVHRECTIVQAGAEGSRGVRPAVAAAQPDRRASPPTRKSISWRALAARAASLNLSASSCEPRRTAYITRIAAGHWWRTMGNSLTSAGLGFTQPRDRFAIQPPKVDQLTLTHQVPHRVADAQRSLRRHLTVDPPPPADGRRDGPAPGTAAAARRHRRPHGDRRTPATTAALMPHARTRR